MYRQMPRNPSILDALGIGEMRDVINDYLVDDILFCVFQISDVDYVLMLCDEVTDSVNISCISQFDVGYFKGDPPGTILVGGLFPALVGRYSRNAKHPTKLVVC